MALSTPSRAQFRSFSLQPRQPQSLSLTIPHNQVQVIHLHLDGGIIGVRETAGSNRPLWLVDLGRGGNLSYVISGNASGKAVLEITSFERERRAEVSVSTDPLTTPNEASAHLLQAEDLLASAELIRRHWPGAPSTTNPLRLYDHAFSLAADLHQLSLERLILIDQARYLIFHGKNYVDGQALLEKAIALPSSEDAPQQALAWKTLSSVRYDLGEYSPSITAGQQALALYQQTGDVYWQGVVLGNLASVYSEIGRNSEALSAGQQALEDAENQQDLAGVVYCLSQLANLYQQQGDLESASRTFQQGLSWVSTIGYAPLVEAEIDKDLGGFYIQTGSWELATRALHRSLDLEKGQNDPVSLEVHGMLALILQQQGKLNAALSDLSAAIAMADRLGLKQDEADLLLKRSSIDLSLGHNAAALADVQQAGAMGSQIASLPAAVAVAITRGDIDLQTDPTAAIADFRGALELARQTGESQQEAVALASMANAQQQNGHMQEAAESIAASLQIVEASRGNLATRDLQVSYFSLHRRWYELAVDIEMMLDREYPGKGYSEQAFAYTERARAQSLLDTLQSSGYSTNLPATEDLREQFAQNQHDVANTQSQLAHGHDGSIEQKLHRLYGQQQEIEQQISATDPRLGRLVASRTVDTAQIERQLLDDDSVLLSYWIGEQHSYRWMLTRHGMSAILLPSRAQLERTILPLEHMLQNPRSIATAGESVAAYGRRQRMLATDLEAALARAGSMLLASVPTDTRTILLIEDGCLSQLPFAALRVPDRGGYTYALRRYSVYVEPSTLVALSLQQHVEVASQPLHVTVFADPVFSSSDSRLHAAAAKSMTRSPFLGADLTRLVSSSEEARSIARQAPRGAVTLETGFDASPDHVQRLSGRDVSILHFASHTVAAPGHPELTGIALSMWNREGREQDGIFWLKDIYALHLHSSLVVLSGCGTSKQNSNDEEDLDNLSYAFFFAGAHAVVGSLWAVDDDTTSTLMRTFYRFLLKDHQSADQALRNTQLQMLANSATSSPSAWASFVLEGMPASYSRSVTTLAVKTRSRGTN